MVTLDRLLGVLGGYGASLCCCPVPRDAELHSILMHDATDDRATISDVFLAVGVRSTHEAIRHATRANAIVALVRASVPLDEDPLIQARAAGIAVIAVDPTVSWSQLASVVYGLVFEGRETEAGRGPTDLFALADTLASTIGGAVTIEDRLSRVLAYSSLQYSADQARLNTILGRRVSEQIRELFTNRGVFKHLDASDEPLFVSPALDHGLNGRVVIAVRAGKESLGSIWVESETPLGDEGKAALQNSARTVALHLLRSRASADLERQVESDVVTRLLEGTADATALFSQLGLARKQFRVVAMQAHTTTERHAAALLVFERTTTGFGWSRLGRSTLFGNTVYTILPVADNLSQAREWVTNAIENLPSEVVVSVGIGGEASSAELPASRQEADECLALHEKRPGERTGIAYDESWDELLLQRLRTAAAAARAPARGPIVELRQHDNAYGTTYVRTLKTWLSAQGELTETAELLGVHPNTVRYRLRKMADVTNLELGRNDKRLAMIIALAASTEND